ncbi:uncharacterized protein T551_03300 [Pneumocystis jirovecii RU7]|uniref:rRNA-processing protein n=1 Tax=Pneumocystis jirovecii (strain RU7) TaxID=1408657 RepID=A0A0W4ZEN9_PNEJ7|nr:uncharacterized protein T551_03300 [Pneumocystis jirovecii RU7]KTW26838.1 hypothetical protein T551_03300 [Pneumocystis jirovecii RU7]
MKISNIFNNKKLAKKNKNRKIEHKYILNKHRKNLIFSFVKKYIRLYKKNNENQGNIEITNNTLYHQKGQHKSWEKRVKERQAMQEMKKKEKEIIQARQEIIEKRKEITKKRQEAKREKERFEAMKEKMHKKRIERLRRREKRSKMSQK